MIAMHSFNNTIAFGAQADGWQVSMVLGPLMLLACLTVPRLMPRSLHRRLRASPSAPRWS